MPEIDELDPRLKYPVTLGLPGLPLVPVNLEEEPLAIERWVAALREWLKKTGLVE